jgi:hypothetical protein
VPATHAAETLSQTVALLAAALSHTAKNPTLRRRSSSTCSARAAAAAAAAAEQEQQGAALRSGKLLGGVSSIYFYNFS